MTDDERGAGQPDDAGRADDLRARLAAADPAASLAPVTEDRVRELLEATMTDDVREETGGGWWRRWPALAAAAAVLVLGGVAGGIALSGDDPASVGAREAASSPTTATSPPAETAEPEPGAGGSGEEETGRTALSLSAEAPPPNVRCRMVTAEALATMETAFAGTVTEVDGETVTFEVDRWFAGGGIDVVQVLDPPALAAVLEGAPGLEPGQRYLVTAFEGQVTGCGFTAPWSPRLEGMFERAFG